MTRINVLLVWWLAVVSGCSGNLLVQRLRDHGVTPENTAALKFTGSQDGATVRTTEPELIESVWARIYAAERTNLFFFCGEYRVEFYTDEAAAKPAAVLNVNCGSSASHVEGDLWYHDDANKKGYYGLWRCPGLSELIEWHTRRQYQRRKVGTIAARETPRISNQRFRNRSRK